MFVGIIKIDFHLPFCHSLKEKRHLLSRLKGRVKGKFSIQVSEVGYQDKWQRAELGLALVGSDQRFMQSLMDQVLRFIEESGLGELLDLNQEIVPF